MKKLLIALCALGISGMAFANDLPSGHYAGKLITPFGATVKGDGDSTASGINVRLEALPDLGKIPGNLSADISLSTADCFNGTGKLNLDKPFLGTKTFNVTANNCKFANNTFTGNYDLLWGVLDLKGTFSFSRQ